MTFQELGIISPILKALDKEGYKTPTPIQECAIPPVMQARDLLGCAQTGTGKTAAFAVPILQLLHGRKLAEGKKRPIRALVLTPTRELALQIYESFESYGRFLHLRACVVFGGVSQVPQVEKLKRGVDILVATPGRLNDLIGQGFIDLKNLEIFVLDEADRMLDMGFIHDVKKVIAQTPPVKQTLLFSATMPREIQEIADNLLKNPVKVEVTPPATTVEAIDQSVYFVDKNNKSKLLIHLLKDPVIVSALVFTRTKHGADRVVRELSKAGTAAQAIHGNKSQNARQEALNNFKRGKIRVLVATDIAARGIDIEELSHVINFDIPEVPETYVHRIGRTGRAGLSGIAVSFCTIDEKADWNQILKLTGREVRVVGEHPYPMQILTLTPKSELRRGGRPQVGQAQQRPAAKNAGGDRRQPQKQEKKQPARTPATEARPLSALEVIERQKASSQGGRRRQQQRGPQKPAQPEAPAKKAAKAPERAPERVPSQELRGKGAPQAKQENPRGYWRKAESVRQKPQDQPLSDRPFSR